MFKDLPFPIGSTFYDGNTIDSTALGGDQFEGQEFWVPDNDPKNDNKPRTQRYRKLRIVRNVQAATQGQLADGKVLPKSAVTYKATAGEIGSEVDGPCDSEAERVAGLADEYLPSGGVPVNDLFYIVVEGPALGMVSRVAAEAVISLNDRVIAATAATSGATSAGRLMVAATTAATDPLYRNIVNAIGRALSAKTTADTGTDILIDLCIRW